MNSLLKANRSLLSPLILFPALWVIAAIIGFSGPLDGMADWSWTMVAVVLVVPVAFIAGGAIGTAVASGTELDLRRLFPSQPERMVKILLAVLLLIGWAELVHQFIKIGGVPLFSSRGNEIRFDQGGASIVLTNLLTVVAIFAFTRPKKLLSRDSLFYLAVGFIALAGFATQLSRGSIVLVVVASVFARWLYWGRPNWKLILGAGLVIFTVVVGLFYFRSLQNPYLPFEAELLDETLPGLPFFLLPLVPFYYAITPNFEVLDSLVEYFPGREQFGAGKFNAIGFDLFIPGTADLTELTAQLTPPWITGTVAGPLWADGGFVWVVTGLALIGLVAVGVFVMAVRTGALGWCLAGGYVLYMTLFGVYQSLWTQQVDWMLVLPLLVMIGFLGDRPLRGSGTIEGVPADPPSKSPPEPSTAEPSRLNRRHWLVGGLIVVGVLFAAGWIIQRSLPEPLPADGSRLLPPSASGSAVLMTDGTGSMKNEPVYWLNPSQLSGDTLRRRPPLTKGPGQTVGTVSSSSEKGATLEVAPWRNWRDIALFELTPLRDWLEVTVSPSRPADGPAESFRAPIDFPPAAGLQTLSLANWSGSETDLFITSCLTRSEDCRLRIFSGESNFRDELKDLPLPFTNLDPRYWTPEIGGTARDFFLVHHGPGLDQAQVIVLSRKSDFSSIDFKRDLDLPGRKPPSARFLLGTRDEIPALYFLRKQADGRIRAEVFPINLPVDF